VTSGVMNECAALHPYHADGRCNYPRADEIHGPSEECGQQPCISPEAHHAFVERDTRRDTPPSGTESAGVAQDGPDRE
jgi:hypothetical protein